MRILVLFAKGMSVLMATYYYSGFTTSSSSSIEETERKL